jgi:pimeloyl-ACP methyl ester carboxylesterase
MKNKIVVEGLSLAYQEVNPQLEQTLFFIHNNSGSSSVWVKQLQDHALHGYRLIAIDLPAHGDSAASETPDTHYGIPDLGRVIGIAIQELANARKYVVIGFSIGANILVEALDYMTPVGIVLAAPTIVGQEVSLFSIVKPDVDSSPLFTDDAPKESVSKLFSLFPFSNDTVLLEALLKDYYKVKAPFRSTMFRQSIENGNVSDEFSLLNETGVPVLIIVGEEEEVIRPDYLDNVELNKWNNIIYKIPAAGHFVHLDQPEVFNKLLLQYAHDVVRECHAS